MKQNNNSNESGVAIIIVLGFMAVILFLIITFINFSILDKNISNNYNSLQSARIAVQTAYNRALAIINYAKNTSENIDLTKIYSSYETISGDIVADSDGLSELLITTVNGSVYTPAYNASPSGPENGPYWQYLMLADDTGDTQITARIAYVVIVDIGKIDPAAAIDSGLNNGIAVSEDNEEYSAYGKTGRPGRDVNELLLKSIDWLTPEYLQKMSSTNASGGLLQAGERWGNYLNMFQLLGITDGTETADSFQAVFILNNPKDPESFWIDNGDLQCDNSELFHRFNLFRNDWDSLDVDLILGNRLPYDNSTSATDIHSIYWLRNWTNKGDFANADLCKKQIAANIIDYCDSDTDATTDNNDDPTYLGLERCPYINEIALNIKGEVTEEGPLPYYRYKPYISIEPVILQLVNIYNTSSVDAKATVSLTGEYNWSFQGVGLDSSIFTYNGVENFDEEFDIDVNIEGDTYKTGCYNLLDLSPANFSDSVSYDPAINISISGFRINTLKVKLMDYTSTSLYDFSNITADSCTAEKILSTDGNQNNLYFDSQVNDPRQNLLQSDWTLNNWDDSEDSNIYSTNKSTIYNPNPDIDRGDGEDTADYEPAAVDPWEVSTAYIRNAPMKSPWELGFIHRGDAWQTINLKKYNNSTNEGVYGGGGGGEYFRGDANILDQIKMTSENSIYGKINLNSNSDTTLQVLFQNICTGSDKDDPGSITGTIITSDIAKDIANEILAVNGTNGGTPFYCRSEILNNEDIVELLTDYSGLDQNNDAKKEEIIGKFINLTKAEKSNFFNIIAVAQTIKDVEPLERYTEGVDLILATQKILVTVYWNNETEKFKIISFKYLDD